MTRFAMVASIAVVTLGIQASAVFADEVPTFDVAKNCRADVRAYSAGGGAAACLADEKAARETLVNQWPQFAPENRARCMQLVTDIAGSQSYIELLTCLQLGKDVKSLPKNQ